MGVLGRILFLQESDKEGMAGDWKRRKGGREREGEGREGGCYILYPPTQTRFE